MTDRELLEAAAKAAGVFLTPERLAAVFPAWKWVEDFEPRHLEGGGMSGTVIVYSYSGELSGTTREEWSPLTDDGDAFRLAVTLRLGVDTEDGEIWVGNRCFGVTEKRGGADDFAATRRAIVRAAAALAKDTA